MNTRTKAIALTNIEKNLFYLFLFGTVLLLGSYLYLWQSSVWNIVARNRAEQQIGELTTRVATLEADYLALASRQINADFARSLGFRDITAEQNYAVKANQTITLSLSANEI